jgi:putative endonuclease
MPRPKQARWFVYMLECAGGRIYTGVTPDVAARFEKHRAGAGGAFTRSFPPRRILAAKRCAGRGAALSAEHGLKQLARHAKLAWARRNKFPISRASAAVGSRRAGPTPCQK